VLCVGALLVGGLIFLAVRALSSRNTSGPAGRTGGPLGQARPDLEERGHERPTYDSRRVESSGGIGTGPGRTQERDYDRDDLSSRRSSSASEREGGGPLRGIGSYEEPSRGDEPPPRRMRDRDDDDDVRSGGGIGGG